MEGEKVRWLLVLMEVDGAPQGWLKEGRRRVEEGL